MAEANGFTIDLIDLHEQAGSTAASAAVVQPERPISPTGLATDSDLAEAAAAPEDNGDSGLLVEDRLTTARRKEQAGESLNESERRGLLRLELARFADAARRLAPPGADWTGQAEDVWLWLGRAAGALSPTLPASLRQVMADYSSPDVWRGMGYVAAYLARGQANAVRRRMEGNYVVDDFGLDEEFLNVILPLAQFMYRNYWRVGVSGIENIPQEGAALLVSNHSGVLPFDGAMISTAILNEMIPSRLPRALVADWFPTLPFISILLQKTGQVQASPLNALRLLQRGELVVVFPEGYKGVGKLYRDRYQLARFGRGGFIRLAIAAGVPIIPVAVVGAEETYPMIARSNLLARLLGFPFFPITPTFPWTGLLGFVPLPSKWTIDFGPPIVIEQPGARSAANPVVVSQLAEQVRSTIQWMLLERLAKRRSVLLG